MKKRVRIIIIGAGSAGLSALAEVQRQTDDFLVVNQGPYGTSCARVACMPTKTLGEVAHAYHTRQTMKAMGIGGTAELHLEIPNVLAYVKRLRDFFVEGLVEETAALGDRITAIPAQFIEPTVLRVGDDIVETEGVVIATGSSPVIPEVWEQFGSKIVTTDRFFDLDDLPTRMAVIGLGPSGIEFAQSLCRLGIDITAFDITDTVASLTDPAVSGSVVRILQAEFPIFLGEEVQPRLQDDTLTLRHGGKEIRVDMALLATGRRPNLAGLGLEELGIETDAHGIPAFDPETMQIGDLPLFIAGDANGYRPVLHEAIDEGRIAGYNVVRSETKYFQRRTPLTITYTEPQIAQVGTSFRDLRDRNTVIGEYDFSRQSRARMSGKNKGLLRIYLDKDSGHLQGAELAAPQGEHLAHLLAWGIQQNLTVFDLLKFPFYHPAVEEGLRTALRDGMRKLSCDLQEFELLLCNSTPGETIC